MDSQASLNGRVIAMTGATSHTGRRLARRLIDAGATLRCMSYDPANRDRLPDKSADLMTVVSGSAESANDLDRLLEGADTLIHLAGQRFTPGVVDSLKTRGETVRLIVQSSTRRLSRFDTPTKRDVVVAEEAVEQSPDFIMWTILRPAMIFGGPDDNNIERLAATLRKWKCFPLFGSGDNLIQPLFVLDLIAAHVAALEHPDTSAGKSYTLAGPKAMPYRDFIRTVAHAAGVERVRLLRIPRRPALLAASALHFVWRNSPVNPEAIERFGEDRAFDISPAQSDLGYTPTDFETALTMKFEGKV
jgi:nucleoside-diphosphate-sugar epimerase